MGAWSGGDGRKAYFDAMYALLSAVLANAALVDCDDTPPTTTWALKFVLPTALNNVKSVQDVHCSIGTILAP